MDEQFEDHLISTIEFAKDAISEILIDGELVTTDKLAVALAMLVQLESRYQEGIYEEDFVSNPTVALLSKRVPKDELTFEGIDPSVLEAVYSACDSAENNQLEEWESDLIITRIVEKHSGARKLAHNTEQ